MSNLYTRLQGAITTALGGITWYNYLKKYLWKTLGRLCQVMSRRKTGRHTDKDGETEIMGSIPVVVECSMMKLWSKQKRLFKCNWQICSHGKFSREWYSVPLKTLRYMTAFIIIMGQLLNWDVFLYQWFQCKSFPRVWWVFQQPACMCVWFILFAHVPIFVCVCVCVWGGVYTYAYAHTSAHAVGDIWVAKGLQEACRQLLAAIHTWEDPCPDEN